jgi:hypothetical protein
MNSEVDSQFNIGDRKANFLSCGRSKHRSLGYSGHLCQILWNASLPYDKGDRVRFAYRY